jgi:hypothetical protein
MDPARVEQGVEQRAVEAGSREDHVAHHVIKPAAGDGAALARIHLAGDFETLWRQNGEADLREGPQPHLTAQAREGRILGAVDADRDDRRVGLVGDHAGAVEHLHQRAGDGDPPFREDDQGAALADRLDHRLGRHRVGRIDREGAEQLQGRDDPPALRDPAVDGEGGLAGQEGGEQQAVDPGDVVDDDDGAARRAGAAILAAGDLDP